MNTNLNKANSKILAVLGSSLMILFSYQNCAKKNSSSSFGSQPAQTTNGSSESNASSTSSSAGSSNYYGYNDPYANLNTGAGTNTTNTGSQTGTIGTGTNNSSSGGTATSTSTSTSNSGDNVVLNTVPNYSKSGVYRYYHPSNIVNEAYTDYAYSLAYDTEYFKYNYQYQEYGFYVYDRSSFRLKTAASDTTSALQEKNMMQLRACLYAPSGATRPYHFTYSSTDDKATCTRLGAAYVDEGLFGYLFKTKVSGTVPVYRCYWTGIAHLTTPNKNECVQLNANNQVVQINGQNQIMPFCGTKDASNQEIKTNCVDILGYGPS